MMSLRTLPFSHRIPGRMCVDGCDWSLKLPLLFVPFTIVVTKTLLIPISIKGYGTQDISKNLLGFLLHTTFQKRENQTAYCK